MGASGAELAKGFRLGVQTDVYRKGHNLPFYQPLAAQAAPPAGWCSWYFYGGGISEEEMKRNTDWLADNLKRYGLQYVQLDDGYETASWTTWTGQFPSGGQGLARYIHSKGFKAGLWLTPFSTNQKELVDAHPDWFLRDAQGKPVPTFARQYTLDATNPQAIEEWFKPLMKTVAQDWGYDYFKFDGQPTVVEAYRANAVRLYSQRTPGESVAPVEAYRAGLRAMREVLGDQRYVLACWFIPTEAIGLVDGCRVGGDVEASWSGVREARRSTQKWLYLNNVCWADDPDVVCVRPPLSADQARAWASFVALTGQLFMASDRMYALPEDRVDILRRVLPVCFMRPLDLYGLSPDNLRTIDLRVERPFGGWDAVGLFNWFGRAERRESSPAQLGLPGGPQDRYVGYDFWNRTFIAPFAGSASVVVPPTACRVIARASAARPADAGQHVASRHAGGGGVGGRCLVGRWRRRRCAGWAFAGRRRRPVRAAPCRAAGAARLAVRVGQRHRRGSAGEVVAAAQAEGPWLTVTIRSPASQLAPSEVEGAVSWNVRFRQADVPMAAPAVAALAADATTYRSVHLGWQDPPGTLYAVRRDDGPAVLAAEPAYQDNDVQPRTAYRYAVSALDWSGQPGPAAMVQVATPDVAAPPPAPDVPLTALRPKVVHVGYGGQVRPDASADGQPMRINGRAFAKGIGAHADAVLIYPLQPAIQRFVAGVGVDDEAAGKPNARVEFRVFADGALLWQSPLMSPGQDAEWVDVAVPPGCKQFRLEAVDPADDVEADHADWVNAGFLLGKAVPATAP